MSHEQIEQTTDQLMARMLKAKSKIFKTIHPSADYMSFMTNYFPVLDSEEGKKKIRSVWNFRSRDIEIIEKFEQLPYLIKNS